MDYFELRVLDAQKQLLDATVIAYQESLKLTQAQYDAGLASDQDVAQAETQLNTTLAQATDLGIQRAQLEHAIATLLGKPASSFSIASIFADCKTNRHSLRRSVRTSRTPSRHRRRRTPRCRGECANWRGARSLLSDDHLERRGGIPEYLDTRFIFRSEPCLVRRRDAGANPFRRRLAQSGHRTVPCDLPGHRRELPSDRAHRLSGSRRQSCRRCESCRRNSSNRTPPWRRRSAT